MPNNPNQLEDKFRRSSIFHSMINLQDYLEYATNCRDEIQVYFYMEENHIHTDQIEFWLAMLNALKLKCQFKLIIKKLLQIKKSPTLRQHPDYHQILHFEDSLTYQLETDIRKRKHKKRRSLQQFQLFSISKIQKKKRKVGGIEIYVDEECRDNYKLEDYSEFFVTNMKDEMQARRYEYERRQERKPLSFLGMSQYNISKWSIQLIQLKKINHESPQQQKHMENKIRENSKCKVVGGNNSNINNNNKRFSISRKSNANINNTVSENNPEILFKTPKESIYINTPIKNKCNHQQSVNKQSLISTPPILCKHLINDKSLLKACRKSERHERIVRHSSPQEEIQKLLDKQQQFGRTTIDYFDDDTFNYPQQIKEVIRLNNSWQNEDMKLSRDQEKIVKEIHDKKEDKLDLGCLEWSLVENEKEIDLEEDIDKQLKETIFMTQLENIESLNYEKDRNLNNINSTPISSMNCQQDTQLDYSINEFHDSATVGVVMCLKSTQTFQSIDSNQQNIFSIHKPTSNSQSSHHLQAFRKDRKLFQTIPIEDKTIFITNDSNNQSTELQIKIINDGEIMSLEGNDEIQQMIDQMDNGQQQLDWNKNIVLETLRKKKLSELVMNQIIKEDEKEQNFGTHSQKKSMININGLKYISQEKSYNSERRYNSRERFSSGCFGDFS